MLILGKADVREALPMGEAVELMKQAFAASARGDATIPPRTRLSDPAESGVTLVMSARVDGASRGLAVKIVSVFDDNPAADLPRVQSAVIVLEPDTGRPLALVEGAVLTAIRTAATSGAATDVLARPGSETLIDAGHVRADLGQLVIDPELRPRDPDQPTLFKSVGVAVQDVVAAAEAVETAERRGLGIRVDL